MNPRKLDFQNIHIHYMCESFGNLDNVNLKILNIFIGLEKFSNISSSKLRIIYNVANSSVMHE